jgi:hypothetical protein
MLDKIKQLIREELLARYGERVYVRDSVVTIGSSYYVWVEVKLQDGEAIVSTHLDYPTGDEHVPYVDIVLEEETPFFYADRGFPDNLFDAVETAVNRWAESE